MPVTLSKRATLSLAQVDVHATDIVGLIAARKVRTLTPGQLIATVENYCDDPTLTRADIFRIRIRAAQMLDLDD